MDIKKGDIVTIKAGVGDHAPGVDGFVPILIHHMRGKGTHWASVPKEAIIHVDPAPLKVGDRVRHIRAVEQDRATVKIIAIDEDHAWVKNDYGYRYADLLSEFRRL